MYSIKWDLKLSSLPVQPSHHQHVGVHHGDNKEPVHQMVLVLSGVYTVKRCLKS